MDVPVIAPGTEGVELILIVKVWSAEVPHGLEAFTVIFPAVAPAVTVILVVPCPAVITDPAGTDHVYEVAPLTEAIE